MNPASLISNTIKHIYKTGMTTTSGGNISVHDPDGNIWITPSGIDKGNLSESDISCIKRDGTIFGKYKPSSEYPFHKAIYQKRPDIKAIIHAHPPAIVSFSIVHKVPDIRLITMAKDICGLIGYATYELPGSEELGIKIADVFKNTDVNAVVMENHAVVVGGFDIKDAYRKLEYLEFCAATIINASLLGMPNYLTDEQLTDYKLKKFEYAIQYYENKPASKEDFKRKEIVKFVHRAYLQKLMNSVFGDISVRVNEDTFLMTQTDILKWEIDEEDIILVQNGEAEINKKPAQSIDLHYRIYKEHKNINSIIHTQPFYLMAFISTNEFFDVRTIPESWIFLQDVPRVDLFAIYPGNDIIPKTLNRNTPAVLINNDSFLVTGDKLIQTFDRLEIAEFSAKSLILAKKLGKMEPISSLQIDALRQKFLGS